MSKRQKKVTVLTRKATKIVRCKNILCSETVVIDVNSQSGLCWKCTLSMCPPNITPQAQKTGNPAGWKFMSEFVDRNGNVYFRGVEQPKLKGTLPISNIDKIKKDQTKKRAVTKKKKEAASIRKEARLVKQYEKKQKELKKIKVAKKEELETVVEEVKSVKKVPVKSKKKVVTKKVTKKPAVKKVVKKTPKKAIVKKSTNKRSYTAAPKITQQVIDKMTKMYKQENNRITSTMIKKLGFDKYRIKATLRTAGIYGQGK